MLLLRVCKCEEVGFLKGEVTNLGVGGGVLPIGMDAIWVNMSSMTLSSASTM